MSNYTNNWQIAGVGGGSGLNLQAASQNTISIGSLTSGSGGSVDFDWNHLTNGLNSNVKKYEVFEISQDLLALSVCWARIRKQRLEEPNTLYVSIAKLIDSELFRQVNGDDIAHANTIRDYYSKKIMVWKLKNINLTPFREDLNTFIHSNGKTFKETMMPLVYRLPEFYDYDVEFEKMSFDYNKEVKRSKTNHVNEKKQLKFIKQLSVNKRLYKRKEYWFSDSYNNLVTLSFDANNPLISLLDTTLTKSDISVMGNYRIAMRDGNEYLKLGKFTFV